jgi:diaminopimelate epimerase
MSKRSFAKYQGAGNDFILIDDRDSTFPLSDRDLIAHLCRPKIGIGADGLILLQKETRDSFHAPLRMRIFNLDGLEAEGCGNGLRCVAKFLLDLGFAKERVALGTFDRVVHLNYIEDWVEVEMGRPQEMKLHLSTSIGEVHFVNTGVPHVVHFVDAVPSVDLPKVGKFLRHHPLFQPKGANVNVAALLPDGSVQVRTFERGVEGETLACGTGGCAVAAIANAIYALPWPLKVCFPGGDLFLSMKGETLAMAGPAIRVFEGTFSK